jgi:hypothetical protein
MAVDVVETDLRLWVETLGTDQTAARATVMPATPLQSVPSFIAVHASFARIIRNPVRLGLRVRFLLKQLDGFEG